MEEPRLIVYSAGLPGCIPNFIGYASTKKEARESLALIHDRHPDHYLLQRAAKEGVAYTPDWTVKDCPEHLRWGNSVIEITEEDVDAFWDPTEISMIVSGDPLFIEGIPDEIVKYLKERDKVSET